MAPSLQIPARLPKLRNPHLPELYAKQAAFQAELALVDDEASRLELAKAWYAARMAADRVQQNERGDEKAGGGNGRSGGGGGGGGWRRRQ